MTSQETIYSLQEALKQERFKNAIYKKQVAQYQRDLQHRDSIIENLRNALAKRRKKSSVTNSVNASQENIPISSPQTDRADCALPSSQTTVGQQYFGSGAENEFEDLDDNLEATEELLLNSSLSDTAVDSEPSSMIVTPRRHNGPSDYTVERPHRPRADGDVANVLPSYVEHPSPSLRALNRKRSLDENDDTDLQQLQPISPSANLERMNSFEQIFRRANQRTPKDNMSKYQQIGQLVEKNLVDTIASQPNQPRQNQTAASSIMRRAESNDSVGRHTTTERRQQRSQSSPEFAYVDVVRNRYERSKLHGRACPCCSDFYRAVGTLPDIENTGRLQNAAERINRNSRHREVYKRPRTPPGFWDVEFPSSQELKQYKESKISSNPSSFDDY